MFAAIVRWFRAAWEYILQWLWCSSKDPRSSSNDDFESKEQLLGPHGISSTPVAQEQATAAVAEAAREGNTTAPALADTTIIVMRHGHRQDEEDPFWHQHASRPWDPPLSVKGKQQAAIAAGTLSTPKVDYVITSPFQRCLQTSAGLVKQLGLQQGQWLVDWQLSEICDPRVLFSGRQDSKPSDRDNIEAWMWNGLTLDRAIEQFVRRDCKLQNLAVRPVLRATSCPSYPETLDGGLLRYSSAIHAIGQAFAGRTVLLVTHGECVRMAVLMAEPNSEVFEVKHTGFVVLQPQQSTSKHPAHSTAVAGHHQAAVNWRLTSMPGETGVLWLEDD